MLRLDSRGGRALPQPAHELRDGCLRPCGDDLDTTVREILDPAVELQTRRLLRSRSAVVNALHAARHEAANRLRRAHASIAGALACLGGTQRQRRAILRSYGIHARRPVRLFLNLPFRLCQEATRVVERIGGNASGVGLLRRADRLAGVAHFLHRRRGYAAGKREHE